MKKLLLLLLAGCSSTTPMGVKTNGTVDVISVKGPGQPMLAGAAASFPDTFDSDLGCINPREIGPCHVRDCPDGMVAPPSTHLDVGSISISVAGQSLAILKFSGDSYQLQAALPQPPLWNAGDAIDITLLGASSHLLAPGAATITTSFSSPVDFSQDLPITWTSGGAEEVLVINLGKWATCRLPADSGSGSIPASVLAALPSTGAPIYGYTARQITEVSGDVTANVTVETDLYGSDGNELTGSLQPK